MLLVSGIVSVRIEFSSQKSWDFGFNRACLHCLVIASGCLLRNLKLEHTVRYASGEEKNVNYLCAHELS